MPPEPLPAETTTPLARRPADAGAREESDSLEGQILCGRCGGVIDAGAAACPGCGLRLAPSAEEDPGVGSLLGGRYRLHRELGRGATASVFEAVDEWQGARVAVKVMVVPPVMTEEDRRHLSESVSAEWRAGSRLDHPLVVKTLGIGQVQGRPFLVMEHVDGGTLARRLASRGTPSPEETVAIVADVLSALDHAHRMGVIHRDVKPSNILLGGDGRARLADFGIAKIVETIMGAPHTQTGFKATPAYMSPEQAAGTRLDHRVDLFSTGLVAFECLAGHRAYEGNHAALAHQIVTMPLPPTPGLPQELRSWLERACAKAPEGRFATAEDMRRALVGLPVSGSPMGAHCAETFDAWGAGAEGPAARHRSGIVEWLLKVGVDAALAAVVVGVAVTAAASLVARLPAPGSPAPAAAPSPEVIRVLAEPPDPIPASGATEAGGPRILDAARGSTATAPPVPPIKRDAPRPPRTRGTPAPQTRPAPEPRRAPAPAPEAAGADPRNPGEALLARMTDALGERDAIDALRDLTYELEVDVVKGARWPFAEDRTITVLFPDRVRERISLVRQRLYGPEGGVERYPLGQRQLPAHETALRLAFLHRMPLAIARAEVDSLAPLAGEPIESSWGALDVLAVTVDGATVTLELDPGSGLPRRERFDVVTEGGAAGALIEYDDWVASDGIWLPARSTVSIGEQTFVFTLVEGTLRINAGVGEEEMTP